MIHYLWWVPSVFIYYCIYTYLSKKNNDFGGHWFWMVYIWGGICPLWVIISRISDKGRLLFNGILYDNLAFTSFVLTMVFLGAGIKFTPHQWIGLGLIVTGSILMRL